MSYYYEPVIWHQRGARSHSVFNDRTYAMPVRRHEPVFVPPRVKKYSSYHDYGIDDTINRADYLSNAVLEDTYEAAARSRGKDHELLRNLNAAIVSTELHVNPRVAAVSRRVRASSVPPALHSFPGQLAQQRQQYAQEGVYYRVPGSFGLYASRPPLPQSRHSNVSLSRSAHSVSIRSVLGSATTSRISSSRPSSFTPIPRNYQLEPPRQLRTSTLLPPVKSEPPKSSAKIPSTPSTLSVGNSSVKIPAYYAAGGDPNHLPVSDLRRRLRRTIAKAKRNPDYFRE